MTRIACAAWLVLLAARAQVSTPAEGWIADAARWKAERGTVNGTSDGKSDSTAVLGERDYGDFELRFDLRIKRGAAGVHMRGVGTGPVGVELKVDTAVRWLVNGAEFLAVSSIKPGEWRQFRIVSKGGTFSVFQNEAVPPNTIIVGHLQPRGKLALVMPAGAPSEIEFKNIQIKE